jgi:hypothetical protein
MSQAKLVFKRMVFSHKTTSYWVFHSFYEEMGQSPPPISTITRNLFLSLSETIAQSFNNISCYVCRGANMGDQWPWEAKELDPPKPPMGQDVFI